MRLQRRHVIGGAAAAAGLCATGASLKQARNILPQPNVVYMDTAHLCPMSPLVVAAFNKFNELIDRDPSGATEAKFEQEFESAREKIAASIGADSANEIAIVRNCTEANATIVNGLSIAAGDEVLVWDGNHESNNVAWDVRAAREGWRVRRVSIPPTARRAEEAEAAFAAAITSATRALALTHVSNHSGFRLPVDRIAALGRRHGLFVHVDGAQSWGVLPVDVSAMGCDSFSASSHKWVMGPRETGMLYVRKERTSQVWPHVVGLYWGDGAQTSRIGARKFDCFGQRNSAAIAALGAAFNVYDVYPVAEVQKHNARCRDAIASACAQLGLKLASPQGNEFESNLLIIAAAPNKRAEIAGRLYTDHRVAVSTKGGIRLSPHIYNTETDLEAVKAALNETAHLFRV